MKSDFFKYTLTRRNCEYIRTQADFVNMNPEVNFLIARVFQLKAEKYPKMKIAFERACEFHKALVCDIGKIDAEIDPVISNKFYFPPVKTVPNYTEFFQDMSIGETKFPKLGVIYKRQLMDRSSASQYP